MVAILEKNSADLWRLSWGWVSKQTHIMAGEKIQCQLISIWQLFRWYWRRNKGQEQKQERIQLMEKSVSFKLSMSSGHCFSGMSWKERKVISISFQRSAGPVQEFKASVAGTCLLGSRQKLLDYSISTLFRGKNQVRSHPANFCCHAPVGNTTSPETLQG